MKYEKIRREMRFEKWKEDSSRYEKKKLKTESKEMQDGGEVETIVTWVLFLPMEKKYITYYYVTCKVVKHLFIIDHFFLIAKDNKHKVISLLFHSE